MLFRTNIIVCVIIILGFVAVSAINYSASRDGYMNNIEQISNLTSEGIYYRLESIFAKPINISMAMSVSPLLKEYLSEETGYDDENYIQAVSDYLNAYRLEYGYDSVFLVSAKTNRYYNYEGVNRVLDKGHLENIWYYSFLESHDYYTINIDNDEAAHNEITVFVNCRIRGEDGATLGIVGVGLRVNTLQNTLEGYAAEYNADVYLINQGGGIELAIDSSGYRPVNFFDTCGYAQYKNKILENKETGKALSWWVSDEDEHNYVVTRFIPGCKWHLIIEHNMALYNSVVEHQLLKVGFAATATGLLVLIAITYTISRYNRRIIDLTSSIEKERQAAFRKATEQLYDNIYELNITKQHAIGSHTKAYFESLGIPGDTQCDKALKVIAAKSIKEEFRDGYVFTFSSENVLREFEKGNNSLQYDLMSNSGCDHYYWLRIMAHVYYREEDSSVCMFTYRKNIDAQKREEARLKEQAQLDGLTHILNKTATEYHITKALESAEDERFAFFVIDIDDFKQINDSLGHAFGDLVIIRFSAILKSCFRESDVIGRIGGDEFAVFCPVPDEALANNKASELSSALNTEFRHDGNSCKISASIGVSIAAAGTSFESLYKNADSALYETKRRGKNGFSVYKD